MSICMIILRDVAAVGVDQLLGDGLRLLKRFFNPFCTGFHDRFQPLDRGPSLRPQLIQ